MAAFGFVVVDGERRLMGMVTLQDLMHAPPAGKIADITDIDPVYVRASWPEDGTMQLFQTHDALGTLVLDDDDRGIGILSVNKAMDIIEDEVTGDFHKGGGTLALNNVFLRPASTLLLYRKRMF